MNILSEARKAVVAVLGIAGLLVSTGLLHGQALTLVNAVVAVLTAASVYLVPNRPKPGLATSTAAPVDAAVLSPDPVPVVPATPAPPA